MLMRPKLTPAMVRALEQLVAGRGDRRVAMQTIAALEDLELVAVQRGEPQATAAGATVLEAYRIGRSRWGAA